MLITVGTSFHAELRAHSLDMDAAYEVAGQRGNWFFDTFLSRRESPALPPRPAASQARTLTVHPRAGDRDHRQSSGFTQRRKIRMLVSSIPWDGRWPVPVAGGCPAGRSAGMGISEVVVRRRVLIRAERVDVDRGSGS